MFQRIANALVTRLLPDLREQIREVVAEERERDKKLVRELVGEMDDVLEKFNRVVAREAMRRSRAMKQTLDAQPGEATEPAPQLTGKDAIRARVAAMRAAPAGMIPRHQDVG